MHRSIPWAGLYAALLQLTLSFKVRTAYASQCVDNEDGLCEPGTPVSGTALFQSQKPALLKTGLVGSAATSHKAGSSRHQLHERLSKATGNRRYAAMEREVESVDENGFAVIIPGLGTEERAAQVERNIQWLKQQDVSFDCWIYVYNMDESFPSNASRFNPCRLIRHPGFWMSHVLELPLSITRKPWILHMMDGITPQSDVNLMKMLKVMVFNGLGHAAPTFGGNVPNLQWDIMAQQPWNPVGRVVDFIELHMDVFSREYFACLQDNIDNSNTFGWGMDWLLPGLCGGADETNPGVRSGLNHGRIGLMDHMTISKPFGGDPGSYSGTRSYDSNAAKQQMNSYMEMHQGAAFPRFQTLAELKAPP